MNLENFKQAKLVPPTSFATPTNRPCFLGAWYYKVVSNLDRYLGIEATVTLPEFIPDENRYAIKKETTYPGRDDLTYKLHLDSPSIYMGGKAKDESDVGLGYFRGYTDSSKTTVSEEKFTFRPFWRYIYQDENGNTINKYDGTTLKQTEHYYLPGDKLKIMVVSPVKDFLQMTIEVIVTTTIPKYVEIRSKLGAPATLVTPLFPSKGYGEINAEFKRVNAIDQYSNEGKPAQMTSAYVTPMKWENVYLFKEVDGVIVKHLFDDRLIAQRMKCPKEEIVISQRVNDDSSGEIVSIQPNRGDK
jgi:hypothetical protein